MFERKNHRLSLVMLLQFVIPLIVLVAGYSVVSAQVSQQVTVTATVPEQEPLPEPDTVVIFRGISYPSSTLTIQQDSALLAQLTTDGQARFDVSAIVTPGTHTYAIFGNDSQGVVGKESNFTLTLSVGTTTTISGIFLGPTITIDRTSASPGEALTLAGTTAPSSTVNVTLNSTRIGAAAGPSISVETASADGNGRWVQILQASDLGAGSYEAKAQAIEPQDASVSEYSKVVAFDITGTGQPPECAGKLAADINCDGSVDLIDFSILLYYWEATQPSNARADINTDGIVNIIDFSIMMFYWTG